MLLWRMWPREGGLDRQIRIDCVGITILLEIWCLIVRQNIRSINHKETHYSDTILNKNSQSVK